MFEKSKIKEMKDYNGALQVSELARRASKSIYDGLEIVKEEPKQLKYGMDIYIHLLNMIILGQLMFECIEFLSGTTAYKKKLKTKIQNLLPDLEKIIDEDWGLIASEKEHAQVLYVLNDGIKVFLDQLELKKFAAHKPAQIAGFGELMAKFHMMPEWILHHNGIKIKNTEKLDK